MSILIKELRMPEYGEFLDLVITSDGVVRAYDQEDKKITEAVELSDHGDLIEKDPLFKKAEELEEQASAEFERYKLGETNWEQTEKAKWRIARLERIGFKLDIADAPVVIPAEREIDQWWERSETVNTERSENGET